MKTGLANLPLHPGRCPKWLFPRMKALSGAISETIIDEYGTKEFLKRISNPFFFQSLGCAIGFDWHSSGLSTTTCGALKESLNQLNTGIQVAGGKGKASNKTPSEIENSSLSSTKTERLVYASKTAAKVDNSLLQDGFNLYHHSFFFDRQGNYAIVQQGMDDNKHHSPDYFGCTGASARRYHWLSDNLASFIEEPHQAVCCNQETTTLDLTSRQSRTTRNISLDLVKDNPHHFYKYFTKQTTLAEFSPNFKHLSMTARHWIKEIDLTRRDKQILEKAYQFQPKDYEELISLNGMGPKKIRALALVSDLIYGSEASWKDPVKYSFAHGGKDGTPFPVDKLTFDHSISYLKETIKQAKLNQKDKLSALKRLHRFISPN